MVWLWHNASAPSQGYDSPGDDVLYFEGCCHVDGPLNTLRDNLDKISNNISSLQMARRPISPYKSGRAKMFRLITVFVKR